LGETQLAARLKIQAEHSAEVFGRGVVHFHIENVHWLHYLIDRVLRVTGMHGRAYRNFRDIRIRHNDVTLRGLPPQFDGFTMLHLSDLHLDLDATLTAVILERIARCQYDICVMTGDFRNKTHGPYEPCMEQVAILRRGIESPVYAVLGNHDFIETMHAFEEMEIELLINEAATLERGGETLALVGIDDSCVYMLENMQRPLETLRAPAVRVLLSHAPGVYRKASALGFDLMLCGHTHGGQICLPGGIAVFTSERVPRRMVKGAWRYRTLQGYTSPGTGSCAVAARLFCPPEMTLHHLRRMPTAGR